jgi:hypothetical protein
MANQLHGFRGKRGLGFSLTIILRLGYEFAVSVCGRGLNTPI